MQIAHHLTTRSCKKGELVPGCPGFTLMEVLVSMVILGICITILFNLLSGSLRNVDKMGEKEKILRLAQMKMNELLVQANQGIVAPKSSGSWDSKYQWDATTTILSASNGEDSSSAAPPPYQLAHIKLSVNWTTRGQDQSFPLETSTWMPVLEKKE
jgi:prepilin-type N-terminal cleavage/methylation domain-containing protein